MSGLTAKILIMLLVSATSCVTVDNSAIEIQILFFSCTVLPVICHISISDFLDSIPQKLVTFFWPPKQGNFHQI